MRQRTQQKLLWTAALVSALLSVASAADARRSRYRPQPVSVEEDDPQYYQQPAAAAATQVETEQAGVVLVSSDPYNGLYGRQTDPSAAAQRYRGSAGSRAALAATGAPRTKEPKQPPVQTIRNYSKVNDDGSFTFGYEAADGSFKEETRGTDCVVRGKYGYVDPDGNKREFTYVSGNPCDPNNPEGRDPQQAEEEDDSGEENIPKVPIRPLRPLRPTVATPPRPQTTTTVFQNDYRQDQLGQSVEDEVDDEPQQLYTARPASAYSIPSTSSLYHQYDSQQYTTPAPLAYRPQPQQAVSITPRPRPAVAPSTVRSQLPATTYRPQLLATATPRPQTTTTQLYTRPPPVFQSSTASPYSTAAHSQAQLYGRTTSLYQPSSTVAAAATADVDFDDELRKFQLENNVVTTPRTVSPAALAQRVQPFQHAQLATARPQQVVQQARKVPPAAAAPAASSDPIYSSELVYDPSTGQYNTVLYQTLPQTQGGELNLRASIQPYVAPQQSQQQHYFQQLLQSQQLYAQQRQRSRYEVTTPPPAPAPAAARQQQYRQAQVQQAPQTYYYVAAPAGPAAAAPTGRESLSHGQIEAFLRGHNIAF
ncbi:E1A-binding protein p400-like isoform X1 [Schistocerca nitens]|uniref:E1A-binding protein p400-like isoform X1 n=1 Tax=Schistocerca nitens TaxID=7011 RepID=UPI002118142E|nr:E1A-binding protein p400-like isoform X1 [Schistocerca nitens]